MHTMETSYFMPDRLRNTRLTVKEEASVTISSGRGCNTARCPGINVTHLTCFGFSVVQIVLKDTSFNR
jgi:hypothetical protein